MKVPAKYLFYDGLPDRKDINKIMAQGGYHSLPAVDTSNYHPITEDSVYDSIHAAPMHPSDAFHVNPPKPPISHNPNGLSDYLAAGIGLADSLIPGERIHKNYPTQPLPVYNPYQYGTGSSALMREGGSIDPAYLTDFMGQATYGQELAAANYGAMMYGRVPAEEPGELVLKYKKGKAGNGVMLESYDKDTAKSGIHIKPSHKGRFTAYKKRTGKTTEEALHSSDPHVRQMANFARNAKKWHHGKKKAFDGIALYPYDIEMADSGISLYPYDIEMAANGTDISPDKAKEMLRDGTAHGKKLTSKQKRYFGWIAGGSKAPNGTLLPGAPPNTSGPTNLPYTPQSRTDAYLLDDINQVLASGQRTKNTGYAPEQQQMLNDAYLWQKINGKPGNAVQNIQNYFSRPVNPTNPVEQYRGRLSKIGYGPVSMYNTTPNESVRQPVPPAPQAPIAATKLKDGGFVEGSIHDLPEEQIAKMLKAGYRFEHFKD